MLHHPLDDLLLLVRLDLAAPLNHERDAFFERNARVVQVPDELLHLLEPLLEAPADLQCTKIFRIELNF